MVEELTTRVVLYGRMVELSCDLECHRAQGIGGDLTRSEGGHRKPDKPDAHNRWCCRECERCTMEE